MNTELNNTSLDNNALDQLMGRLERAEKGMKNAEKGMKSATRRARLSGACALAALALTGMLNASPLALAQTGDKALSLLMDRVAALETRATSLEAKAPVPGSKGDTGARGPAGPQGVKGDTGAQGPAGASPFTVSGTKGRPDALVTLSGYNLQIVDGSGRTLSASGLGNLIVGYNEARVEGGDARTGSHNLILGDRNNYTSFGGIVAGYHNTISNTYATVTGGLFNTASGFEASVTGGSTNIASGDNASVSGGYSNAALASCAAVTGGDHNVGAGEFASVLGGHGNTAFGEASTVSGGDTNNAGAYATSISGGYHRYLNGATAWGAGSTVDGNKKYFGCFTSQ